MGNQSSHQKISREILYTSKRLKRDYHDFIDKNVLYDNNTINNGISSGDASSCEYISKNGYNICDYFFKNGYKINIWKDINFAELLRGRKELIQEWINDFNNDKPNPIPMNLDEFQQKLQTLIFVDNQQKESYIRRYKPIEEELKIEDSNEVIKIKRNIRNYNSYVINKIETLIRKHGYQDENKIKLLINYLKNLPLDEKGRCTSGIYTFLEVLKNDLLNKFENSDKDFYLKIHLSTSHPDHLEIYDKREEEIRKEWDEKIYSQFDFIYTSDLKTDSTIELTSEYLNEKIYYTIPEGLLNDYNFGDTIKISKGDFEYDNEMKIFSAALDLTYKDIKKIKKCKKCSKYYYLDYNGNERDELESFIKESIKDFEIEFSNFDFESYSINS